MRALVLGLCVAVSGCTFGLKTCPTGNECGDGNTCVSGFCVEGDAGMAIRDGGTDGGVDAGRVDAGPIADGGPDAGDAGSLACDMPCPVNYACQDRGGSRTCEFGWSLRITSPTEGQVFDGGSVRETVVAAEFRQEIPLDAGAVPNPTFTLTNTGARTASGSLAGSGLSFSTPVGISDAGSWTADVSAQFAELDGGPRVLTARVNFVVDREAPVVVVDVVPRDAFLPDGDPNGAGYWKKDELAVLRISVDDPSITLSTTDVKSSWNGAVNFPAAMPCGCATTNCYCATLDLAGAPVPGVRAMVPVGVGALTDRFGNTGIAVSTMVGVTRFKWQRAIGNSTVATPLAVAVSERGVVVAGTQEAGPTRLTAFRQDGEISWVAIDAGTVTTPPVVSLSDVWVGTLDARSRLQPISVLDGGLGVYECDQSNANAYEGELALGTVSLGTTSGTGDRPIGVRNGQLRVADGTCNSTTLTSFFGTPRLVMRQAAFPEVFVTGASTRMWKAHTTSGQAWVDDGDATFSVAPTRGLFLDATNVGASGGGVSTGGAFYFPASGAFSASTLPTNYSPSNTPQAGPLSVGTGYVVYGDFFGRLVKVPYVAGAWGSQINTGTVGGVTIDTNPIIGAGGLVYAVSSDGSIFARRVTDLGEEWRATTFLPVSGNRIGQGALDVLRTNTGAKSCRGLGVLFIPTSTGPAAKLTALLVDSEGLDRTAPWPKYQRDNANSANASRTLDHWSCP